MFVRSLSKVSLACLAVCVGTSVAVAQKNPGKIIKAVVKTPNLNVIESMQPPLRVPGALPSFGNVLRQNVVYSLQLAAQREEAKRILAPATTARQRALAAQTMPSIHVGQDLTNKDIAYIAKQTSPVRHYLATHDNTWPTYLADGSNNRILRHIRNFMQVENPSASVLAIQRELIRMRASSQARSPQEVRAFVRDMLEYGIVPQQVSFLFPTDRTEEELALGEDIAFAIAASKVPVENNPWQMEGTAILADKVATYNAMRRVSPLEEGLPATYTKNGIHEPNFPTWTQAQYTQYQLEFAQEHPFEYVLAPYREKYFGTALPKIYNALSDVEKRAIMFHAPALAEIIPVPTLTEAYYDEVLERWIKEHHREPVCRISNYTQEDWEYILHLQRMGNYHFLFHNEMREEVPFYALRYEQQVETLVWAWKNHRIDPQAALKILYR